jgi:5'-deoxynucleotidase YfbR-like HD superfamily hydrolase
VDMLPEAGGNDSLLRDAHPTFVELNDLKRIVSAGRVGSIATRMFRESWVALVGGAPAAEVAWMMAGRALAAARLGDIDAGVLTAAGLSADDVAAILRSAVDAAAVPLPEAVRVAARDHVISGGQAHRGDAPAFVEALAAQPRAGLTCPGRPRIILEPPENHADHCLIVAVYGVLLAPSYGADAGTVFLAALAHHFHNAGMPDSGFTGEVLLGSHLETVMAHYAAECLKQLPPGLRGEVERARAVLPDVATLEGRAFHAADVIDRVLQIMQYMRAGALTPERMLGEMELVHAGPVKTFHDDVLRQAGLL